MPPTTPRCEDGDGAQHYTKWDEVGDLPQTAVVPRCGHDAVALISADQRSRLCETAFLPRALGGQPSRLRRAECGGKIGRRPARAPSQQVRRFGLVLRAACHQITFSVGRPDA